MNFLITGASGHVGKWLVKELSSRRNSFPESTFYLLIRPRSKENFQKYLDQFNDQRLRVIEGDITEEHVFTQARDRKEISQKIQVIIHGAAYYNFNGTHRDHYMMNVVGTQNIINFAYQCESLTRVSLISTIAIAGDYQGHFRESDFDLGQQFDNFYAQTKFESEKIFRSAKLLCAKDIFRLGVVLADSSTGLEIKNDGPYYIFSLLANLKKRLPFMARFKKAPWPVPMAEESKLPVICVDHCARLIVDYIYHSQSHYNEIIHNSDSMIENCFHVFYPDVPKASTLLTLFLAKMKCSTTLVHLPKSALNEILLNFLGVPKQLSDYLYSDIEYDQASFLSQFSDVEEFSFKNVCPQVIDGAYNYYMAKNNEFSQQDVR